MTLINPPAYPGKYEDRFLDCKQQLDRPITELILDACRAGWSVQETLAAVVEIADNQMLAAVENRFVEDKLKALRQSRR